MTLQKLRQFLIGRNLAKFKLPDELMLVSNLPKTAVGKVDKKRYSAPRVPHGIKPKLTHKRLAIQQGYCCWTIFILRPFDPLATTVDNALFQLKARYDHHDQ